MAVPEQTPYKEYTANGITKIFPLEFDVLEQDHLIVLVNDLEPSVGSWSLDALNDTVVFALPPANGANIKIRRDTPMSRSTDYQTYNNSFRPEPVNKDLDNIWRKLQEMGVLNWMVDNNIKDLGDYVDGLNDETKAQFLAEIQKQGISLSQLENFTNQIYQNLANVAVSKGWFAEFVADGDENQKQINDKTTQYVTSIDALLNLPVRKNGMQVNVGGLQGGHFTFIESRINENDGISIFNGWLRTIDQIVTPFMSGALPDESDSSIHLQKVFDFASANNLIVHGANKTFNASNIIIRSNIKITDLNINQNIFNSMESILTTDYGSIEPISNIELINVNLDGKRSQHINVTNNMDGGRCCFLVRRPIKNLTIRRSIFKNAVTDGLMLFPVDWITPSWDFRVKNVLLEDFTSTGHGRWGGSSDSTDGITFVRCVFKGNGFDLIENADYTTGLAARRHEGLLYGGGWDFEEYEGRAYSKNINIIDCNMTGNAGASLIFVRTGFIELAATNINISGGKYDKGLILNSTNTQEYAIATTVYSAPGVLNCYNISLTNVDLSGNNLALQRTQQAKLTALKNINKVLIDQSVIDSDQIYGYSFLNSSSSLFKSGITENGAQFLGESNKNSRVWVHINNTFQAISKLDIRGNGVNIGGIWFEKAQPASNPGVNFLFKNNNDTVLSISQYGTLAPLDNISLCGSSENRWKEVFAATGVINTSDERLKQQFRSQTDAEKAAAIEIKNSICLFKFNDAVEEKGDSDARWHCGAKAQQIVSILRYHNLDPFSYAFVCYDEWEEQREYEKIEELTIDEKGHETFTYKLSEDYKVIREAGNRYSIRYDQLAMFIISAI